MTGTDAQIKWAEDIIANVYANLEYVLEQKRITISCYGEMALDLSPEEKADYLSYVTSKIECYEEIKNAYDRLFASPKRQSAAVIIDNRKTIPTADHIYELCVKNAKDNNISVIEACKTIYSK